MKKVFNQVCLLESNKLIIPWKFIFCYRYHKWVAVESTRVSATVSAYGINDKNEKIALFEKMELEQQPELNSSTINNTWLTSSIIVVNDKNLINVWIEIDGYQYIELKKFDLVIKDKALPGIGSDIVNIGVINV